MTLHRALYESIKEEMPSDFPVVSDNFDENSENCGICFKGGGSDPIRHLDGSLANRTSRVVINYNTKDMFAGYDYGKRIVEALIKMVNIGYRDNETGELIVVINNIKLTNDVNFIRKNRNNGLNCFSINFMLTYGEIKEVA